MTLDRLALAVLLYTAPATAAEPCLHPDSTCSEHVDLGDRYMIVYRNFPLETVNPTVDRALIMVHGAQRNGDGYFSTAMAAAAATGNLLNTIVIAPAFRGREGRGCNDTVQPGELYWSCQGWNAGLPAVEDKSVNSFTAMDRILALLNNKTRFPKLKSIVVAGHSGGGQFMQRYAAMNRIEETIDIPVRYVVANPSSYVYLDSKRPPTGASCTPEGKCQGAFGPYSDRTNCTTYNNYRYGLESLVGYAEQVGAETIRKQFPLRNVTYLIGDLDALPDSDLDKSCPANAQGINRRERGLNFWNYIQAEYHATHKLVVVPRCGHNAACVFTASAGAKVLFPPVSK